MHCLGFSGLGFKVENEAVWPLWPQSDGNFQPYAHNPVLHLAHLFYPMLAGTRSIQMLYRAILFTFAPTAVELVFVVALLTSKIGAMVAALVGVTFVTYVAWTMALTQMAVEVRKEVNTLDNLTTSKAVDALLNAETVALFNNQALEVSAVERLLGFFL
jgi:ABC-type transport system involved in Fe-S cluster assembly fused permease/ATPase subunit